MNLAIITGASRGIGAKVADIFLENHWKVINLSRQPSNNKAIQHIHVDLKKFDINQFESSWIEALHQAKKIAFVHCAGLTASDTIENTNESLCRDMMEVNVFAAMKLLNHLVPFMKKDSSIVLVGSTLSYIGVPNTCSYIVSKHALLGLMRSVTQDLAYKGIHACCVCPGCVKTDMLQELADSRHCDINDFKSLQLFNRFIKAEEIANLIYFCSQNPVVNGGLIQANLGN